MSASEFEISWDDERLVGFPSDTKLRNRYRRLQSWYRQEVLRQPFGRDSRGRPIGSLLDASEVEADPTLNFLRDKTITAYVEQRIPEVRALRGALDEDRLRRNMLSSQPLCFNIFGYLRRSDDFPRLLGRLLDAEVVSIDAAECEWTPPGEHPLKDKTAFDAFVAYTTRGGHRRFLGIETKYTDSFSPKPYPPEKYEGPSDDLGWFRRGQSSLLSASATNQIWRNALLAASINHQGAYGGGISLVLTLEEDRVARRAVERVQAQMEEPGRLALVTYERVIAEAAAIPGLADWASRFSERYMRREQVEQASRL